jgi:chemotaxis protein CheX
MAGNKTVLIIDDDAAILDLLSKAMQRLGLNTATASNAEDARSRLAFQEPDLLLLDLNLPRESGVHFLARLRQTHPKLKAPICVITGMSMEEIQRSKVMSVLGVEKVFTKPFNMEELAAYVTKRIIDIPAGASGPKKTYDATVINAFLGGTIAAVKSNSGKPPEKMVPLVKDFAHTLGEFSGVILFHGKKTRGVVALSFERQCIIELANAVFQGAITEYTDEILVDFAGELCNQVAGQTQAIFQASGDRFEISTPTLIQGKDHRIVHKYHAPCLILPFQWGGGKFYTEFILEDCSHLTSDEPEKEVQKVSDSGDITFL